MSDTYLHRGDAPFGDAVWDRIDEAVVAAAKAQLTTRRLLHVDGPFGLGLKAVPTADQTVDEKATLDGVQMAVSGAVPLAVIRAPFTLSLRDIAAFEQRGVPLDLSTVHCAAAACAQQEDDLLLNGSKAVGTGGLLTVKSSQKATLGDWADVGAAVDSLITAVTTLDDAGFHGPYALVLAPALFNRLYRRYPQGNLTELEHLKSVVTEGVVKAPALKKGGVLIASGRQYASIVIGQDLAAGFVGPAGGAYEFVLTESVALRVRAPEAICILQ